jgi:Adenosyl cobinamide kinase/adenosyl cobinamide phosphate guanylyltransferase
MILIVGGVFQGKKEYAKNLALEKGFNDSVNIWSGINLLVMEYLKNGLISESKEKNAVNNNNDISMMETVKKIINKEMNKSKNCIIIADEVGMGIVPMAKLEMDYREVLGRILCDLAKQADEVYRVVCGIGQRIK